MNLSITDFVIDSFNEPMKRIVRFYPFTAVCCLLIWYLCFFYGAPQTPLDDVPFIDKWTHAAMYLGTMGVFWIEYGRASRKGMPLKPSQRLALGLWGPILMGGLIEVMQATLTGGRRSGEWMDFVADTLGVLIAFFAVRPLACRKRRA